MKRWNEIWTELKENGKLPKKNQLLILLLAGLLLMVIAIPVSDQTEDPALEEENVGTADTQTDYEAYLEKKVAETLTAVEGVGKTEVMITLRSTGQKIVEKDQNSSSQTTSEEDSEGGTRTIEERNSEKTSVYSQDSGGTQSPYVSKELLPEIEGVLVVAEGGDNPVVVQNVTEAIQALFGVEAHKIKIMKRTGT